MQPHLDINAAFLNIKSRHDLAAILHEPYRRLTFLVYAKDPNSQYSSFEIAKGYKKTRIIEAPTTALKNIQRKLADILSQVYKPKFSAHAFIIGKSIVTNAQEHLRANTILKIDLVNFFGNINFGRVQYLFMAPPFLFPKDVAICIARICCKDGHLPQGAPTSPIISNMICLKLDAQLNRIALNGRSKYTRYADDITFSTNQHRLPLSILANTNPIEFGSALSNIITINGFKINTSKTKYMTGNCSKYITGIKVNSVLNPARRKVREVRAMLHAIRKFGIDQALAVHLAEWRRRKTRKEPDDFIKIVNGKISFISMVKGNNHPVVINLRSQLDEVLSLRSKNLSLDLLLHDKFVSQYADKRAIVYTEGKTDRVHLAFALSSLKKNGLFNGLNLIFYSPPWGEGGGETLKTLCYKAYLTKFSAFPRIIIYDRDTNIHSKTLQLWSNNLWSFPLPVPAHRNEWGDSISIEHYYADETLYRKDQDGRRLFTVNEFNLDTSALLTDPNIKSRKALLDKNKHTPFKKPYSVLEDVLNISGKNICLSKREFARAIANETFRLGDKEIFAFKPIFDIIQQLIRDNTVHMTI